jgi:two-component system sensor histidine kinase DctS
MTPAHHRLLRRADRVPPEDRAAVTEILAALGRGLEQMSRFADQFSQYARLPQPRLEPADLGDVVRSAAGLQDYEGAHVEVDGTVKAAILADPMLLSGAIHNLILNACEAGGFGATVEVRYGTADGKAFIEVLDRGPGLAPEVRERLFEPYVSTKKRGSGLGLSLVRDAVEQHGGAVSLVDRAGGGTTARVVLPLQADRGASGTEVGR